MTKIARAIFIDQSLRADPDFGPECLIKEQDMAVKLVVMYPYPKDIDAFESVYNNEHVPMASENLSGKTKIVATKVLSCRLARLPSIAWPRSISLLQKPWRNVQLRRAGS